MIRKNTKNNSKNQRNESDNNHIHLKRKNGSQFQHKIDDYCMYQIQTISKNS